MMTNPTDPTPPASSRHPYADSFEAYWQAGFEGILPLPAGQKKPVPAGFTGNHGVWPSWPDVMTWAEDRPGANVALRLPEHVIGVDVDAYGDKPGGLVLAELERRLGALPATWRSTSRDDGISGIRLYRVPEHLAWPNIFGPGIESIRFGHRYVVAPPSLHPDTQRPYRWIDPAGNTSLAVPELDELPALPDAWVEHFTGGQLAGEGDDKATLDDGQASDWLSAHGAGEPCRVMASCLAGVAGVGASRHDHFLQLTNRVLWLAGEGHLGASSVLAQARAAFMHATAGDRATGEAEREWDRMIVGGIAISVAAHHTIPEADPCLDPFAGLVPREMTKETPCPSPAPSATEPASSSSTIATSSTTSSTPSPPAAPDAPATEISTPTTAPTAADEPARTPEQQVVSSRLQAGGAFILDIPDKVPAIWGESESVLWAEGEALTICGPAGVGKTTLTGQVIRARLVGGDVLDLPVTPTSSKVLYLAMDRPRQIARALRRTLGDLPREVLDERIVFWPGPPIADVAAHPETLLGLCQLAGADTVIVDSIKDAAVGLSSDEVGAGYNRARQMCISAGVQVLEQHHMVKKGENGASPKNLQDMYGSVWIGAGSGSVLLLYGAAGDPIVEMRHLKTPAEEVGPYRIMHDHAAGRSSIWHQSDLVAMARATGSRGLSARQAASSIEEKENPSKAEVEKARRRLDKLADQGLLERIEGSRGGQDGSQPAVWRWVPQLVNHEAESNHETNHGRDCDVTGTNVHEQSRTAQDPVSLQGTSNHETNHGSHAGGNHVSSPLSKRGGTDARTPRIVERTIAGERVRYDLDTRQTFPLEEGGA